MKKNQILRITLILFGVLPIGFSACIKDKCTRTYTYTRYEPVYRTKAEVRANIRSHAPRVLENTGKFYILGNYIFLTEIDKGIHVIDNSNPASPRTASFIDIPGNLDIAVKGNTLYADLFTDLVAIDISNPSNVVLKKVVENAFPHRYYSNGFRADTNKVIVDWKLSDTTITTDCGSDNYTAYLDRSGAVFISATANAGPQAGAGSNSSPIGIGGSMARFTIVNDRLYTVSHSDLEVFNIASANNPSHTNRVNIGWNIETIYPFRDKLFIGSQTGMYIFNISNPDAPAAAGQFQHVRTCDPVIADDQYAYVTLSSGTTCAGFTNELDILKLNDLSNPQLLKVYPMTNPKGLSKSGTTLFICDGTAGVKVYNASDVMNLQHIKTISGIDAFDVIAWNNVALVVAKDGLYQYDYSNTNDIRLLSKIEIEK